MTVGEQLNDRFTEIDKQLASLEKRVAALETPNPPPPDMPFDGELFVEIDSSKIDPSWPVVDMSQIPGSTARLRLPPNHLAPRARLNGGIEWRHSPSGLSNHSQLRIDMREHTGRYMSSAIPYYIRPNQTYGFSFEFTYSNWPNSWVNMFQLFGWMSSSRQKDVVALFHKSGGLVCHCYDNRQQSHQNESFELAAGVKHRVALQICAGGDNSHVRCWIYQSEAWQLLMSWVGEVGASKLMQEPDALLDVRFGPYTNSPISSVMYDKIQYYLID